MSSSQLSPDTEVPSHRACAHCRSQKVRCIIDDSSPDVCQRCARTGRSCIFTPLQKRKQRKRTDTRVAELEREMRVMQSMLKNQDKDQNIELGDTKSNASIGPSAVKWYSQSIANAPSGENKTSSLHSTHGIAEGQSAYNVQHQRAAPTSLPARNVGRHLVDNGKDVVERDIISMATARQLFATYREELFPHYPMVPIPESVSADQMRESKPVLFLAIIAAAAGKDNPDIQARLDQEVLQAYATKSLLHSQKSLEMIQALLISAVWYYPPNKFSHLKNYEYIHMAATMAIDLGIGTRSVPHRSRFAANALTESRLPTMHPLEDTTNPDRSMAPGPKNSRPENASAESRRTFVSCYSVCTGVSMSLRRPQMLRVSSYVRECVDFLQYSPDALPSDRMLVAWIRLHMIVEEIGNAFSYDDPDGIASITELRTQLMLKDFTKRLDEWFKGVSKADLSSSLTILYWTTRLYLHEVVLHIDHSPEDFIAPYQMGVIHPWDGDEIPTQILAETVAECVSCSQNLIDIFLVMDFDTLRALPVLIYVRVAFAAFVLAKLTLSANHPESQIGRVLDRNRMNVDSTLNRMIIHTRAALGEKRCRVPAIFLSLLIKLRQWCLNPELIGPPQGNFLDVGMQNPIEGQDKKAQSQSIVSVEGPRVTEQSSTDEYSPQTSSDSQTGAYESLDEVANIKAVRDDSMDPSELSPEVASLYNSSVDGNMNSAAPALDAHASAKGNAGQVAALFNPDDQMELDQNFFQFFGDINGLGEDDLTGLDEWSTLPMDLLGPPNNLNL